MEMQRQPGEQQHAAPVVGQEGGQTGLRFALADQPVLPDKAQQHRQHAQIVVEAQRKAAAHQQQAQQGQALQQADHQPVGLAEQNGGGLDADQQIIRSVAHGVFGVVGHGPQQVGDVEDPQRHRQLAGLGSEGHGNGHGIGSSKHHLGVEGETLAERIDGGQGDRDQGQLEGQQVGQQQQRGAEGNQDGKGDQGLAGGNPAGGQG